MIINRKQLISILNIAKLGVASKEVMEHSTAFCFDNDKIRTYNDLIAVTISYKSDIVTAIPSKEFLEILSKIPDEEIDITLEENRLSIKGDKERKTTLNVSEDIKIPIIEVDKKAVWYDLPENFIETIKFCSFSTSKNSVYRPVFMGLYVNDNEIISCDMLRATIKKMNKKVEKDFLLPAYVVKQVSMFLPIQYTLDDTWIHFRNSNKALMSIRCIDSDEKYPMEETKEFFNVTGDKITFPKEFKGMLERVSILAGEDAERDKFIVLELKKNKITCKGESEKGNIIEPVRVRYAGREMKIVTNPIFLLDILNHLDIVTIGEKLLFEGNNFKHIICLVEEDNK
jgi:DNA polymerase III sliding clamp (beta) subunit (PCNA family)